MTHPRWFHRPLRGDESGPDVDVVNRKLGLVATTYGDETKRYIRGLQQQHGLEADGIVDADLADILGEAADGHLTPEWFTRSLRLHCKGEDVAALRLRLGLPAGDLFDEETHKAVLRFQSARGLNLTGLVTEDLALLLP